MKKLFFVLALLWQSLALADTTVDGWWRGTLRSVSGSNNCTGTGWPTMIPMNMKESVEWDKSDFDSRIDAVGSPAFAHNKGALMEHWWHGVYSPYSSVNALFYSEHNSQQGRPLTWRYSLKWKSIPGARSARAVLSVLVVWDSGGCENDYKGNIRWSAKHRPNL